MPFYGRMFKFSAVSTTRNFCAAESLRNNIEVARGGARGFTVCCVLVEQLFETAFATISLSMLKSKTFVKKTRSGGVLKIVREHYLRDDIWCGSEVCKECKDEAPVLQEETCIESNLCPYPHYLIPDTNVVLHQVRAHSLYYYFIIIRIIHFSVI